MNHTPGPWNVQELLPDGQIIKQSGTYEIQTPDYDVATLVFHSGPIRKLADARLIAAAPDLLEACIEADGWIAEHGPGMEGLLTQLETAIAKSTGKE